MVVDDAPLAALRFQRTGFGFRFGRSRFALAALGAGGLEALPEKCGVVPWAAVRKGSWVTRKGMTVAMVCVVTSGFVE